MKNVILPTRPYQLFFEHRPEYLFAYVQSHEMSYEIARGYWVEILSMLHRRRYKRVLVEKNIAQPLAPHDVLELVTEVAHSGCNSTVFAVYDRYFDPERSKLEEMIGTNRGLRLKIGDDVGALERWLVGQAIQTAPLKGQFPHARRDEARPSVIRTAA